jgi:hypothetical protein
MNAWKIYNNFNVLEQAFALYSGCDASGYLASYTLQYPISLETDHPLESMYATDYPSRVE